MTKLTELTFLNNGIPSLRISTAAACNHRCIFCQPGGDYASDYSDVLKDDINIFRKAVDRFFALGVRHFSLTGGEPLLNPYITFEVARQIRTLLSSLSPRERKNSYLRINTNGVLISYNMRFLTELFDLIKISIHTLNQKKYAEITGSRDPIQDLERVNNALSILDQSGSNVRLQTVIGIDNVGEVNELINFCDSHTCVKELKLFDISEYSELWREGSKSSECWKKNYVSILRLKNEIASKYNFLGTAFSVGGYGNPMAVYETPSGLRIRLRSTEGEAAFGPACATCKAYNICGDGHCNLEIGPNRVIKVCRPKEGIVFHLGDEDKAIDYFASTSHSVNTKRWGFKTSLEHNDNSTVK